EIIATVKTLKKEQQREKSQVADTGVHLQGLEQRMAAQLQLIEQLPVQLGKLEKALAWALWTSTFALILALIALGVVYLRCRASYFAAGGGTLGAAPMLSSLAWAQAS